MLLLQYRGAVAGAIRCYDLLPQEDDMSPESGIWHPWAVRGGHTALLSFLPAGSRSPHLLDSPDQWYSPMVNGCESWVVA